MKCSYLLQKKFRGDPYRVRAGPLKIFQLPDLFAVLTALVWPATAEFNSTADERNAAEPQLKERGQPGPRVAGVTFGTRGHG